MFELYTFGTLDLTNEVGEPVDEILSQSKRALLLAYLACAQPTGYHRRDVLLSLFWPEADTDRARSSLRQALHYLRAALGDAIITRGDEVAVDPNLLRSDVAEMARCETEGRLVDAIALYRGPFLPGAFAKDAPDVERWIQGERSRHSAAAARIAWTLADSAIATRPADAVAWAERAAAITPEDESALRRRMTMLHDVGANVAALRAYEEFAATLAEDLDGLLPSQATQELHQQLRRARPIAAQPAVRNGPSEEKGTPVDLTQEDAAATLSEPLIAAIAPGRRWSKPVVRVGLGILIAVAAAAAYIVPHRSASAVATAFDPGKRSIAVMPFTVRGDHIQYLREGMVDLLSMSLEGAGEIQSVDPSVVLGFVAREDAGDDEIERARGAAQHFQATHFITGTIVNTGGKLHIRVALHATEALDTTSAAVASASADESELPRMIDDLTREVVAAMFSARSVRLSGLAARTTASLPALKSYLRGAQAMRTGLYAEATQAYRAAIARDSSFALAYYGLSMSIGWASEGADHEGSVAARSAVRHARGLSPHDSLLLAAHFNSWNGQPEKAEQEYRQLVTSYPTDPDAWHEFGEVIFHNGATSGYAIREARDAFSRVANIDAFRLSALAHLARIAAVDQDSTALDSLAALAGRSAPDDPRSAEIANLRLFVSGDRSARSRAVAAAIARSDRGILDFAREIAAYTGAWQDAEAIAMLLTQPTRPNAVRALGWATIAEIRAAAGQPTGARAAVARATQFDGAQAASIGGTIAALPFLPATDAELAIARTNVIRWSGRTPPAMDSASSALIKVTDASNWSLLIRAIDARKNATPAPYSPKDSSALVWSNVTTIAVDALRAHEVDTVRARNGLQFLAAQWKRIERAEAAMRVEGLIRLGRGVLLRQLGENAEADRLLATFPAYGREDLMYRAPALYEQARARAAAGDHAGAVRAREQADFLWRLAEPAVRREVR
jgi:DNA-binding SARP family transcriptional activator